MRMMAVGAGWLAVGRRRRPAASAKSNRVRVIALARRRAVGRARAGHPMPRPSPISLATTEATRTKAVCQRCWGRRGSAACRDSGRAKAFLSADVSVDQRQPNFKSLSALARAPPRPSLSPAAVSLAPNPHHPPTTPPFTYPTLPSHQKHDVDRQRARVRAGPSLPLHLAPTVAAPPPAFPSPPPCRSASPSLEQAELTPAPFALPLFSLRRPLTSSPRPSAPCVSRTPFFRVARPADSDHLASPRPRPALRPFFSSPSLLPVPREVPRVQEGPRDRPDPRAHHPVPCPLGGRQGRGPRPARLPRPGTPRPSFRLPRVLPLTGLFALPARPSSTTRPSAPTRAASACTPPSTSRFSSCASLLSCFASCASLSELTRPRRLVLAFPPPSSLGFEQVFKNALTGLMMGGGKGCVCSLSSCPACATLRGRC